VCKASKKGLVHHTVIRFAPVKEEKACEFVSLHTRAHRSIKGEEGIRSPSPRPETVLVVVQADMRTYPMQ
jgi:hypothetical protein